MSAVASAEFVTAQPAFEVIAGPSAAQLAEREMYRWMLWCGLPSLVAAVFVGAAFATDSMWYIGGSIASVIALISAIIWLAMSSDTNS